MPKHTLEPWYLEKQEPGQEFTSIGSPIAVVGGEATSENVEFVIGTLGDWGPHGDAMTEANARRIVDCVNACEHLENPINASVLFYACQQFWNIEEYIESLKLEDKTQHPLWPISQKMRAACDQAVGAQ